MKRNIVMIALAYLAAGSATLSQAQVAPPSGQ